MASSLSMSLPSSRAHLCFNMDAMHAQPVLSQRLMASSCCVQPCAVGEVAMTLSHSQLRIPSGFPRSARSCNVAAFEANSARSLLPQLVAASLQYRNSCLAGRRWTTLQCAAESSSVGATTETKESSSESNSSSVPNGVSETAASKEEVGGVTAPVASAASSGYGPKAQPSSSSTFFPIPKFMLDQNQYLSGASTVPEVEEPPALKIKRKAPKKLLGQDKATAPWGWEGRSSSDTDGTPLGGLEKWLLSKGLPEQKVSLQLVKEGGRGLVAQSDIKSGEGILFVPTKLMMTADQVYEGTAAGPILKAAGVPEWPALAVFLLLEAAKGEDSEWSTYISTLPQTPPCILQWSPEEVDILLKGSPVQRKAIECIADVTTTFRDLDALVFSKHRDVFPAELFTLGLFKWAFAVLFSRLVRLPSLDGKLALVPWADMLNHRCEVESYLDYDSWKQAVVFKTDRRYSAGKEVFASYGPRSNGSLLLAYGVVPTTRNPHDSVELTLGLDPSDPALEMKKKALAQHNLSSPMSFPLQIEGWPSQLLAFLRLSALDASAPPQLLDQLASEVASTGKDLVQSLKGVSRGAFPLDVEIRAREALIASCQVALAGYETSLQEDEAVLAGISDDYLEDDGEQAVRVLASTALRVSERRLLLKTDFVARAELRELRAGLAATRDKKTKIDLGNNFGGDKGNSNPIDRLLKRIVRP